MDKIESMSDLRVETNTFRVEAQAFLAETNAYRVEVGASRNYKEEVNTMNINLKGELETRRIHLPHTSTVSRWNPRLGILKWRRS